MPYDLAGFAPHVRSYDQEWVRLNLTWHTTAIDPNHGKAYTSASFEGHDWLAQISVWETGETELETVRLHDRRIVNKHYDLGTLDLDTVLSDLIGLIRDGTVPPDSVQAQR